MEWSWTVLKNKDDTDITFKRKIDEDGWSYIETTITKDGEIIDQWGGFKDIWRKANELNERIKGNNKSQ